SHDRGPGGTAAHLSAARRTLSSWQLDADTLVDEYRRLFNSSNSAATQQPAHAGGDDTTIEGADTGHASHGRAPSVGAPLSGSGRARTTTAIKNVHADAGLTVQSSANARVELQAFDVVPLFEGSRSARTDEQLTLLLERLEEPDWVLSRKMLDLLDQVQRGAF